MTGDTHYDLEILAELAEGLLDDATAARVREHLAVCDPCGESLADLAAVREVLAAMPVPAMPMGVALRIDKALGAEAATRRAGGLSLDEAPDWDRILADSPWETTPAAPSTVSTPGSWDLGPSGPEPTEPEPRELVGLGVVAEDGSIVPARRGRTARRRSWAMPVAASVAAAVVIGAAGLSATLLSASGSGPGTGSDIAALPVPSTLNPAPEDAPGNETPGQAQSGTSYPIGKSDFNYSNAVLNGPLATYVGATGPGSEPASHASVDPAVVRCVTKITARVADKIGVQRAVYPIGVDQALYEGNDATVMAFWKDRLRNAVWVYVVNDKCANIRPPAVGRWQ